MPPRRARQTNFRGYQTVRRPGPAPGTTRRSGTLQIVDELEKKLAEDMRADPQPWTSDKVIREMQQRLQARGVTDYYLCRHEIGSDTANSWRRKFFGRFGIGLHNVVSRFRATRGGFERRVELFTAWRNWRAAEEELLRQGDSNEAEIFYCNMDETSMHNTQAQQYAMAYDQLDDRREDLVRFNTTYRWSTTVTVTSDPEFRVPPMILVPTSRRADRDALNAAPDLNNILIGNMNHRVARRYVEEYLLPAWEDFKAKLEPHRRARAKLFLQQPGDVGSAIRSFKQQMRRHGPHDGIVAEMRYVVRMVKYYQEVYSSPEEFHRVGAGTPGNGYPHYVFHSQLREFLNAFGYPANEAEWNIPGAVPTEAAAATPSGA
eukprot:g18576.t1